MIGDEVLCTLIYPCGLLKRCLFGLDRDLALRSMRNQLVAELWLIGDVGGIRIARIRYCRGRD